MYCRLLGSGAAPDCCILGWRPQLAHSRLRMRRLSRSAQHARLSTGTLPPLQPARRGIKERYSDFVLRRPYLAGSLTVGGLALLGDAVAQSIEIVARGKSEHVAGEFDWVRCAALTGYGALWNGPFNVILYATYVKLFGTGTALAVALGVAADQLVWMPFGAIPMAFLVTDTIQWAIVGTELHSPPGLSRFIARLQQDWFSTVKACWTVWVPVEIINMWFVPLHLRVAFGAFGSFSWMVALSLVSSTGRMDVDVAGDKTGRLIHDA